MLQSSEEPFSNGQLLTRYNWNIVEICAKHHNLKPTQSWVLKTILFDWWFSLGTPVSSTNKIDRLKNDWNLSDHSYWLIKWWGLADNLTAITKRKIELDVELNRHQNCKSWIAKHHNLKPTQSWVLKTILFDWWFSLGTPVSSTNKIDRHDITEILLKVLIKALPVRTVRDEHNM
jgi:hypothetical protein